MSSREEKLDATLVDNGGTDICRAAREWISEELTTYRTAWEGILKEVTYKLTLEFEKLVKQRTNRKIFWDREPHMQRPWGGEKFWHVQGTEKRSCKCQEDQYKWSIIDKGKSDLRWNWECGQGPPKTKVWYPLFRLMKLRPKLTGTFKSLP